MFGCGINRRKSVVDEDQLKTNDGWYEMRENGFVVDRLNTNQIALVMDSTEVLHFRLASSGDCCLSVQVRFEFILIS